jgi:hypothetical protein
MNSRILLLFASAFSLIFLSSAQTGTKFPYLSASGKDSDPTARRINVPHVTPYRSRAIFWFGKVDFDNNYADVRMIYDDEQLLVELHIMDRRLWSDETPDKTDLSNWDAVSLYLNLDGNTGGAPGSKSYRFDSQLGGGENRGAAYRGGGTGWIGASIPVTLKTEWRGDRGPNSNWDDKGWVAYYQIPFSSLGFYSSPQPGSIWGLGVALNDRDDVNGAAFRRSVWPELMNPDVPGTWGELHFGLPGFERPDSIPTDTFTIRQGLNNVRVPDAHVGGHANCGDPYGPSYWGGWGSANYTGYEQINIQNQWDIADWPCFSKYYVTFPLEPLPAGKVLISATLSMSLFGNAGGGGWSEPPDSFIQVFSIAEDWDEASLNWNNAPLALENISGTWVQPHDEINERNNKYLWDVSRAAAEAYATGGPLRLALYSADGEYHTGKYYWSSDVGDWNAAGRPTLQIVLGETCNTEGVVCVDIYLPLLVR